MPGPIKIEGLKGLKSFSSLSDAEYKAWRRQNSKYLNDYSSLDTEEKLYNTQRFVNLFSDKAAGVDGKELARKMSYEDRLVFEQDYINGFNNNLINKIAYDTYNPYNEDGTINPNKGTGNIDDFNKIMAMSPKYQKELLESGWLTNKELDEDIKKKKKETYDSFIKSGAMVSQAGRAGFASYAMVGENIDETFERGRNKNKIDAIYAKDWAEKEKDSEKEVAAEVANLRNGLKDTDLKDLYIQELQPSETSGGIPQLAAFYSKDGEVLSSEVEDLGPDEMAEWIAKKRVYEKKYGPGLAYYMLDAGAKDYIDDHQSPWQYTGALLKDIGIGMASYMASWANGTRQFYKNIAGGKVTALSDNDGNFYGIDDGVVFIDKKTGKEVEATADQTIEDFNKNNYDVVRRNPYTGEEVPLHFTEAKESTLDYQGVASDGRRYSDVWNNKFWSDAEATGMLNKKDQARAFELNGYSPSKAVYKLGQDKDYLWQTAKMTQFALADGLLQAASFIPTGGGGALIGWGSKLANWANKAGKTGNLARMFALEGATLMKDVGTLAKWTGYGIKKAAPVASSIGIGHQYGVTTEQEQRQNSLERLNTQLNINASNDFSNNFSSSPEFHDQVLSEIDALYTERINQLPKNFEQQDPEVIEKILNSIREQATKEVAQKYVDMGVNEYKSTDEYQQKLAAINEEASTAGAVGAWSTMIKYVGVNYWGYRSHLFKDNAKLTSEAGRLAQRQAVEEGKKLTWKSKFKEATRPEKLRHLGKRGIEQFWGGAWTNYTDELQTAGAKQVVDDRVGAIINGDYDAESQSVWANIWGGTLSYLDGAVKAAPAERSLEAGLVGGLGGTISPSINFHQILSGQFKENWKNATVPERFNMIFQTGLLNTYYQDVYVDREAEKLVKDANELVDNADDFKALAGIMALDLADMDSTNPHDKDAIAFMRALHVIDQLKNLSKDKSKRDLVAVLKNSSSFQEAMETTNKIIDGNFTEEELKGYIAEYYSRNPGIIQSEENNEKAIQTIQANAEKFQKGIEAFEKVDKVIADVEKRTSTQVDQVTRSKLLQRFALDQFLSERIPEIEASITGSEAVSTTTAVESYGNKASLLREINKLQKAGVKLSEDIKKAKDEQEKALERVTHYTESRDSDLTSEELEEYKKLVNEYNAATLQVETLEGSRSNLNSEVDRLFKLHSSEESTRVLTADEILNLSPEDRARMLNEANIKNYSEAQQQEIIRARSTLSLRSPSLLDDIQTQALLVQRRRANAQAFDMMINNPEAAAAQLAKNEISTFKRIAEINKFKRQQFVEGFIQSLEKLSTSNIKGEAAEEGVLYGDLSEPDLTQEQLEKLIYNNLLGLNKYGDNAIPLLREAADSELESTKKYRHLIQKAIDKIGIYQDAMGVINNMDLGDRQKKAAINNLNLAYQKANTQQELLDELSKMVNSSKVDENSSFTKKMLSDLEQLWDQRASTTTMTREERKAAEEEFKRKQAKEEAAREEAERKAAEEIKGQKETLGKRKLGTDKAVELGLLREGNVLELFRNNENGPNDGTDISQLQARALSKRVESVLSNKNNGKTQLHDAVVSNAFKTKINVNGLAFLYELQEKVNSGEISLEDAMDIIEGMLRNSSREYRELQEAKDSSSDTSNDKIAEEAAFNLTDEDRINKHEGVSAENLENGIKTGTEINLESPTLEQQAAENPEKVDIIPAPVEDTTDQGNKLPEFDNGTLLGNRVYGYELDALKGSGKQVPREGEFFEWMDTFGVKLQDIIDNELNDILKVTSKLYPLRVKIEKNATNDDTVQDLTFWAVEYTPDVASIHNEKLGGVVNFNGKQYLMVGTMGYNSKTKGEDSRYRDEHTGAKIKAFTYFKNNPSERFFVDTSRHTEVQQITSGRLVRQLATDEEVQIRSISELLSDEARNPKGLTMGDLKWGIQYDNRMIAVNVSERNTVYPPSDGASNLGSVFLLVEGANGNYIPAYIRPIMFSELNDGKLKTQLNELINELTSPEHSRRLSAIKQLVQFLNLTQEGDNILIGTLEKPTLSIVKGGSIIRTFNITDANFDRTGFLDSVTELNPRVNITTSTLSDETSLEMFDEAGALTTDLAKLGTSGASYNVYTMDADGNPIITAPVENQAPTLDAGSDLTKAQRKLSSERMGNTTYRKDANGNWFTETDRLVTDPRLIEQLNYKNLIRTRGFKPNKVIGMDEIFVINSDKDNPLVLVRRKGNRIFAMSKEVAVRTINDVNAEMAEKARQERLQKELEIERSNDELLRNMSDSDRQRAALEGEDVDLGLEETLTDEQIVEQMRGNFEAEATPQQKTAEELVEKITSDTSDIQLSEDGSTYVDGNGKHYARVTSVISADEFADERFDQNSPWTLPSTTIGTGVDTFVRDYFDNKIGNRDNLAERYPNATNAQLQAFAKQLDELKDSFKRRGLTIVPRDITVTGTVEVKTRSGEKRVIDVAGTLDLLAYDKNGNFYIFDMKTNRSVPRGESGRKKGSKWSKQLSLYKQLLQEKYGAVVKGLEIIPIQVSYEAPKGWGNATTEYTKRGEQLYANGVEYRDAEPTLHDNIPIPETTLSIDYSKLTPLEQSMVRPIEGVAPTKGSSNKTTEQKRKASEKLAKVEAALESTDVKLWSDNPSDNVVISVTSNGFRNPNEKSRLYRTVADYRSALSSRVGDTVGKAKVVYKDRNGNTYVEIQDAKDGEVKSAIVFPVSGRGSDNFTIHFYKTLNQDERNTIIPAVMEAPNRKDLAEYVNTILSYSNDNLLYLSYRNPEKLAKLRADAYTEPSPSIVQSEPVKTGEDINKTGTKSLAELQSEKKTDTALSIMKSKKYGSRARSLLKAKFPDMPSQMSEIERFLQSKGIATTGITDVEQWLDMIENCK